MKSNVFDSSFQEFFAQDSLGFNPQTLIAIIIYQVYLSSISPYIWCFNLIFGGEISPYPLGIKHGNWKSLWPSHGGFVGKIIELELGDFPASHVWWDPRVITNNHQPNAVPVVRSVPPAIAPKRAVRWEGSFAARRVRPWSHPQVTPMGIGGMEINKNIHGCCWCPAQ